MANARIGGGTITGIITNQATGKPIAGASISIADLKINVMAGADGRYTVKKLPRGSYLIQITAVGFAGLTKTVDLSGPGELDFQLAPSWNMLADAVVTSVGNTTSKLRTPIPVTVMTHSMLIQQSATNVIDEIALQPGINEITEGPGISKPVIDGFGYNRVLTLLDGQRQEEFQWGDEHGVLIDPYVVYDAEIIRGAASLQYGANAIGGVINFKTQPAPENGTIKGTWESEYQSNNGLIGNSVTLGGNKDGLVWNAVGSYELAHCYWDPKDGYVWGTAFTQSNLAGTIGVNRNWGYSRLTVSAFHRQVEVPDGNRDSATGQFAFDQPLGDGQSIVAKSNFLSYQPDIPQYQVLQHDRLWWQNSVNAGKGRVIADIGYTQSKRREAVDSAFVGQAHMFLHDLPYSLKYQLVDAQTGLKLTTGVNGMYEWQNNFPEAPTPYISVFLIPDYTDLDAGAYGILEKDLRRLTLSGGIRYDIRHIIGQPMYLLNINTPRQEQVPAGTPGAYTQFSAFDNTYTGLSASIGATYQLPGHQYVKLNLARSYRAPSVNELTSNELSPGSNAFELGNLALKAEHGYEVDLAYGNSGPEVNYEVGGYYNYLNNFIFSDRLGSVNGGDSLLVGEPVFQYLANNAISAGITATLNIHPTAARWFEWDNGFTYSYSYFPGQTDSTRHIPYTPAPRLTSTLRFRLNEHSNSTVSGAYFYVGLAKYWAQNDIYSALYTELPSFAYTLYNTGLGVNLVNRASRRVYCSFYINCTNLFNIAYVDHLSHNQYFLAYNGGTIATVTKQSQGIYNMGRNIGLKLLVPLSFSSGR
ncbi:MAG TPA: TonB-dependent receptor [Puia sp.]|nr:TonB-dependent receptor [Puia sp.]